MLVQYCTLTVQGLLYGRTIPMLSTEHEQTSVRPAFTEMLAGSCNTDYSSTTIGMGELGELEEPDDLTARR